METTAVSSSERQTLYIYTARCKATATPPSIVVHGHTGRPQCSVGDVACLHTQIDAVQSD